MTSRQRYVSGELTHFVGSGKGEERQYELLVHILRTGHLWHEPFDGAPTNLNVIPQNKASEHAVFSRSCICFCDIPVADFGIHVAKYSRFGIGFRKDYLVTKGASPVLYVAKTARVSSVHSGDILLGHEYDKMVPRYYDLHAQALAQIQDDREERLGRISLDNFLGYRIFSFLKFFDPSLPEHHSENFYMEREWRIWGNLNFKLEDVHRVVIPEGHARRLRTDVPNYFGQTSFVD